MRLVDAHCHLESEEFHGQLDVLLDQARRAGVVAWLTAAIRPEEWPTSLALAQQYAGVACALGIHPWYVQDGDLERLATLPESCGNIAKAIGEIGLDSKIAKPSMDQQLPVFERQLQIAKDLNLPVVMHCRGAFGEMLQVLKRVGLPRAGGTIHSFGGSVELAEAFMAHGLSFSLGGTLTYRNSRKKKEVLRRIYPAHFLLETDAPDIPPVEVQERPNVPANIMYNLRAAAETLGISEEEVARQTTENAVRVFNLAV